MELKNFVFSKIFKNLPFLQSSFIKNKNRSHFVGHCCYLQKIDNDLVEEKDNPNDDMQQDNDILTEVGNYDDYDDDGWGDVDDNIMRKKISKIDKEVHICY